MRFNSVKRGNFSGLARTVNKNYEAVHRAGRESGVDFTKIAQEAIKGRSLERRAAMKAEGQVAEAGMQAYSKVKNTKNDVEAKRR